MQVLLANVVIHSIDSTAKIGEVAFNAVRADFDPVLFADVLFRRVIHLGYACELFPRTSARKRCPS